MTCTDYQEKIDLYLDEAMASSDRAEFESHTQECPSCAGAFEQARLLQHAFREMPALICPQPVVQRIFAQTGVDGRKPVSGRLYDGALQQLSRLLLPRPALAGWLLMVFLMVGSYFISRNIDRPAPPVYTAAELEKARAGVQQAFGLFFFTVKKSEKLAREEVFRKKVILPVQAGIRQAYEPFFQKGEL
jgi:hypothetical protein